MKLPGVRAQQIQDYLYVADGTVTTGGTPQGIVGVRYSTSMLLLQNLSSGTLVFEIGSARATATISNGQVSSVSVTNAGGGFSLPPTIEFLGGGNAGNTTYIGSGLPGKEAPSHPAQAHCVMTGTVPNLSVASITIDDPGAGYVVAPYVLIRNSRNDPNGFALPSATSGFIMTTGAAPLIFDKSAVPTESVSVYGGTTGQAFLCRWMD